METTPTATHTSDFSGLRCPHLLLAVIKRVRELEADDNKQPTNIVLEITATDLNAPSSITAWAGQCGHEILDQYQENDSFLFFMQVASRKGQVADAD